jgi:hypothetical protein
VSTLIRVRFANVLVLVLDAVGVTVPVLPTVVKVVKPSDTAKTLDAPGRAESGLAAPVGPNSM